MPRFFFDVHDDASSFDDEGIELPSVEAVKDAAIAILPKIVADEIPASDKDRRAFVVLITDEDQKPVYSATLTFTGMWLFR